MMKLIQPDTAFGRRATFAQKAAVFLYRLGCLIAIVAFAGTFVAVGFVFGAEMGGFLISLRRLALLDLMIERLPVVARRI